MQDEPEQFISMSSALCPLYMETDLLDVQAHSADVETAARDDGEGHSEDSD
ncbi:hypothetical protein RVR_4733 [Actinacidiphila reveromycinica]|uniref:Uncharacterized protein n=1 Tax=Actinacidiphila reveromycinica TaxID=659352 RepID=A0A7U3VPE1_9ACTN|nr:hypothetical protein [Streptomyces sp. SN-593]BBA98524.1 hypothetical protein RVR_4733 [Streptomyces sp. SN-593]